MVKNSITSSIKQPKSMRMTILISFTTASILIIFVLGLSLTSLFSRQTRQLLTENSIDQSAQEVLNIESYLSTVRNTANALYYDVVKQTDITDSDLSTEISLLHASNSNTIVSIALFREDGTLVSSSPSTDLKWNTDASEQSWFTDALSEMQNFHFSEPHVQNLYTSSSYSYQWVITLSIAVDMNENGQLVRGVLMVDLDYQKLQELLEDANNNITDGRYSYLETDSGSIIYHPYQTLIDYGIKEENNEKTLEYEDGAHTEKYEGKERIVTVTTVAYTGWKLISVIPQETLSMNEKSTTGLIVMTMAIALLAIVFINRSLASRVTDPLSSLNDAIANTEGLSNIPESIYQTSSKEVSELGDSLHAYINQISRLMKEIRQEENEKRKNELDALQAQINPHFLYNTLYSIVWMIEGGKYQDAIYMITQLAAFFRKSLNKGKSIITIENEIQQAEAYLNIQKIRYKQSFNYRFDFQDGVEKYLIVKLVIQPILENAIYHGIKEAEQDGEILVQGYMRNDDIYIIISDNGYGMNEEELSNLLNEKKKPASEKHASGSGVGLVNVDKRLRLRFGDEYGLKAQSELDVGTSITIHIPAILATEENMTKYEEGGDHE